MQIKYEIVPHRGDYAPSINGKVYDHSSKFKQDFPEENFKDARFFSCADIDFSWQEILDDILLYWDKEVDATPETAKSGTSETKTRRSNMKQGKVFTKLAQDKRVSAIRFGQDNAVVVLSEGYYATNEAGNGIRSATVKNAHEANAFIRSAIKVPTPREGYRIVYNLMSGLPVEEREGTPYTCSVASESYWSN